jgi:hypothetical protein
VKPFATRKIHRLHDPTLSYFLLVLDRPDDRPSIATLALGTMAQASGPCLYVYQLLVCYGDMTRRNGVQ